VATHLGLMNHWKTAHTPPDACNKKMRRPSAA